MRENVVSAQSGIFSELEAESVMRGFDSLSMSPDGLYTTAFTNTHIAKL